MWHSVVHPAQQQAITVLSVCLKFWFVSALPLLPAVLALYHYDRMLASALDKAEMQRNRMPLVLL